MKRLLIFTLVLVWLHFISFQVIGQNPSPSQHLTGIWIAEDYLHCFDSLKSAIHCKEAFECTYPAGLRINLKEQKGNFLHVVYDVLHKHELTPEISRYIVVNNDTIFENSYFEIDLTKQSRWGFEAIGEIPFFVEEENNAKAYLSYQNQPDTAIILQIDKPHKTIRYKKVTSRFSQGYPFPNPLYYYTRNKTLVGKYTLKDSADKILSSNFCIAPDGKATGYSIFDKTLFYFSTDVYCGYVAIDDHILVCDDKLDDRNCNRYLYQQIDNQTIHLYEFVSGYKDTTRGKLLYKLTRK